MNNKSPIQNRIAALRTVRNISQQALAHELGIERTYLSKVERGRVTPSGALMASVCRRFGMPLEGVFYLEDEDSGT